MALELKAVSRVVNGQVHIQPTGLALQKGTMKVFLGPTSPGQNFADAADRQVESRD